MNKRHYFILMVALGLGMASCNNSTKSGSSSTDAEKMANDSNKKANVIGADDAKFMAAAASGGMMEVQAGQIAEQKGISQEAKDFGQQMVTDHTALNNQLKDLAQKKGVTLPTTLGDDDQKNIDKLNKCEAKDFDKCYIDMMVDDHKKDISAFQNVVNHPEDADVKAWAQAALPTLLHHLDMAKSDQEALKKKNKKK